MEGHFITQFNTWLFAVPIRGHLYRLIMGARNINKPDILLSFEEALY